MNDSMNDSLVIRRIDAVLRFFFYLMIFWLPYSPAVIETSVIAALVLWLLKRFVLLWECKPTRWPDAMRIFSPPESFLNRSIGLFILVCFLATASTALWADALLGFFTKTLEWFVIFFFALEALKTRRHIQIAIIVFLISASAVIFDGYFQLFTHRDIFYGQALIDQRVNASLKDPNSFGAYLFFVFFIVYSRFCQVQTWKGRMGWGSLLAATLGMLTLTYSRSAWMGIIAASFFFLIFSKQRSRRQNAVIISILLVALLVFVHREFSVHSGGSNFVNAAGWRVGVWQESMAMVKEKPLLGHGLNTFMRLFQCYRQKGGGQVDYLMTYAHNCYVQLTVEVGLLGLLTFLLMQGRLFQKTLGSLRRIASSSRMIMAILAGLFAFLIQSFMDVNFYSLQLSALWWCMTGILVAIVQLEEKERIKP